MRIVASSAVVLAVVLAMAASPGLAQSTHVGLTAGMANSLHPSGEGRTGVSTALVVRRTISPVAALHIGLGHVRRGYERPGEGGRPGEGRWHYLRSDHLELALLVRLVPFPAVRGLRPAFSAGIAPTHEIACSAHGVTHTPRRGSYGAMNCDILRDRPYELGLVGGAGLEMDVGPWTGALEFRRTDMVPWQGVRSVSERARSLFLSVTREL